MELLQQTHDIHVIGMDTSESPRRIKEELPPSKTSVASVGESRNPIASILNRSDSRILVVVRTLGNQHVHVIMHRGRKCLNYGPEIIGKQLDSYIRQDCPVH